MRFRGAGEPWSRSPWIVSATVLPREELLPCRKLEEELSEILKNRTGAVTKSRELGMGSDDPNMIEFPRKYSRTPP